MGINQKKSPNGNNNIHSPPKNPNGNKSNMNFHEFGNKITKLLKEHLGESDKSTTFKNALVLMGQGKSVYSPSQMSDNSFLRIMDDTGIRHIYLYEFHGIGEWVRAVQESIETNLILAEDWIEFDLSIIK